MVRVLLSEGSSLSAREAITALGIAGHIVDVCDPAPFSLGRFSRFVRRVYRCPALGRDPFGYLDFVLNCLATGDYDVLLPIHEQAFLFSRTKARFHDTVGLALTEFQSFVQAQSKVSFVRLLRQLAIPHPPTELASSEQGLRTKTRFPFFLKTAYGTATSGVWKISSSMQLDSAIERLKAQAALDGSSEVLVQQPATGRLERVQSIFAHGVLVAWHGYRQEEEGNGGGDISKVSVYRPIVRDFVERIGQQLEWHGALSLDYFFDQQTGTPQFIDANPRLVEPMNGVFSGVNLADILVKVSLREEIDDAPVVGREGTRSHMLLMALLEIGTRRRSRVALLREVGQALRGRGRYSGSHEELLPITMDPVSALPLSYLLSRLLIRPGSASLLATQTVEAYALSSQAVRQILAAENP